MDKKIANNIVLGAFVLLGFGLFLFLVFTIGGGSGFLRSHVDIYGRFSHVKGLHAGSEVALAGLRIGTVQTITVAADQTKDLIVDLQINHDYADRIRRDSIAKIVTQGVLGDKYIEITIGSPNEPVLKDGSFIQTAEVEDLFTKGGSLVEDISREFNKGGNLQELLKNLNKVAVNLSEITTEAEHGNGLIHEAVKGDTGLKLNRTMGHLENIVKKIDEGEGTIGGLINDPTVYEDLKTIMGGAKRSSILNYFMRQFMDSGKEKQQQKK